MITSTLTHTELHRVTPSEKCNDNVPRCLTQSHRVGNAMITSHIVSHGVTPSHTETHRLTTCQKSNDNVPH